MTTFPQALLGVTTELFLGSWTDVSTKVYQRNAMSITRGRPPSSSQISPSQCTLSLNNQDGRFSTSNPTGAYYGSLVRNAPARVSVPNSLMASPNNTTYLHLEDDAVSYASCPAASRIELTGSLDIRVDVDIRGYGQIVFAAIWSASASVNQRSWWFGLNPTGHLHLAWTSAGTLGPSTSAVGNVALPLGRQCVRVTLDATTGNVAFYTAAAGNIAVGPWTQLGSTVAGSGAVTVFASASAPLTVGYSPGLAYDGANNLGINYYGTTGSVYDMELRNGIGGTVVAKPAFNAQSAGATSWTDSPGNSWSLSGTAALSNRLWRYHGEFAEAPKASDPSLTDVYSDAVFSGVMRRIQQGQSPLRSAMYRAVQFQTITSAVAYWPCEDASGATQLASGLSGGSPMTWAGTPTLASSTAFACSAALPVVNNSTWTGAVPAGATWSANIIRFLMQVPAAGDTDGTVVARITTSGTVARMDLVYNVASGGELTLNCYSGAGALLLGVTGVGYISAANANVGVDGQLALVTIELTTSGSNLSLNFGGMVVGAGQMASGSGTITTASIGAVNTVVIDPTANLASTVIGHIWVAPALTVALLLFANPIAGWVGETAGARVLRLCTEEGIQGRIYGHPSLSAAMGAQGIDTLANLLQTCETTDRGMLFEPRSCVGVGYRTLTSMYNQAAACSANFTGAALAKNFGSTMDDQLTLNDVTVTNTDGSSARQVLASGVMSILAPPNGISRVDTGVSVNADSDGQLGSIANWIVHAASSSYDRVPAVPFDLARSQTPLTCALLDIGDMVAVTNPPSWIQYDEIDQLCAGFTETLGPMGIWTITVNGVPEPPYVIAQVSGGASPATHVDTDGSTLNTGVNATATSLSVATVAGAPIWTTNAGDFPFDIQMAGERMTVTNITGASSPQTFTVTRSVNGVVKSQTSGTSLSLWYPATVGL